MTDTPPLLPSRDPGWVLQATLGVLVLAAPHATRAQTYRLYGLAILLVPAVLVVTLGADVSGWQRGWLSLALAVHAFGALYALYRDVWWYDHLAHAASAMLLAGVGYAVCRALAAERPARTSTVRTHLTVLAAVLALGATWELWETQVGYLTVYGPTDAAFDLMFDGVGWLLAVPARRSLVGRLHRSLAARFDAGAD